MTAKERVRNLIEDLPESDLLVLERMVRGLKLPEGTAPAPVSPEERRAKARAAYGYLKGDGRTVDDFLREKHEDTEREEERYRRRHGELA
ncbi:MAG: hypothetical protein HY321_06725 [Armatimonadetes bacterium]|nr:hypothetical protein [Armatimonadota bacterium]